MVWLEFQGRPFRDLFEDDLTNEPPPFRLVAIRADQIVAIEEDPEGDNLIALVVLASGSTYEVGVGFNQLTHIIREAGSWEANIRRGHNRN